MNRPGTARARRRRCSSTTRGAAPPHQTFGVATIRQPEAVRARQSWYARRHREHQRVEFRVYGSAFQKLHLRKSVDQLISLGSCVDLGRRARDVSAARPRREAQRPLIRRPR